MNSGLKDVKQHVAACAGLIMLGGCGVVTEDRQSLHDAYDGAFKIGAAVATQLPGSDDAATLAMLATQFNQVTPENCMKFASIHPEPEVYNFEAADRLVNFAESNGMDIVGHVLVWHHQTPDWVFKDDAGHDVSREVLIARLREHMTQVLGRYAGRIKAWDVVNEAFNDNGSLRQTNWLRIIGPDYIAVAFETAHAIDPDIELYYNDYGMAGKGKREATVALVRELKSKGVRIDGVGMQGHWAIDSPDVASIEKSILAFAAEGVQVHITELDVDVLPNGRQGGDLSQEEYRKQFDPYRDGLPDEKQAQLAQRYADIFGLFLKHHDKIARVTFWGVSDKYSWKNNFPIRGRVNHALLFDRDAMPKPAWKAVIDLGRRR